MSSFKEFGWTSIQGGLRKVNFLGTADWQRRRHGDQPHPRFQRPRIHPRFGEGKERSNFGLYNSNTKFFNLRCMVCTLQEGSVFTKREGSDWATERRHVGVVARGTQPAG